MSEEKPKKNPTMMPRPVAQNSVSQSVQSDSESITIAPWEVGARRGWSGFLYVAAPVVFWLLLGGLGLISEMVSVQGELVLSVLLFVLGIPLSILFRIDDFSMRWGADGKAWVVLLVALLVVLLNFVLIGAIRGALRGKSGTRTKNKKKRQSE